MEKSLKSVLSFTLGQAFSHKVITAKKLTRALVEIEPIIGKDKLIEFVDICINGKEKEETIVSCVENKENSIELSNKRLVLTFVPEYKYPVSNADIHIKSKLITVLKTALDIGLREAKMLVDNVPCVLSNDNTDVSFSEIIRLIKAVSDDIEVSIEDKHKKYKGLFQLNSKT